MCDIVKNNAAEEAHTQSKVKLKYAMATCNKYAWRTGSPVPASKSLTSRGIFCRAKEEWSKNHPTREIKEEIKARQGTSSHANTNMAWLVTFQFPIKVARRLK